MPVLQDRVQETTTTGGTGAITLAGAVTGYRSFAQAFSIGQETYYTIDNGSGEWEIGVGTVGSGTLSRDTVLESSNANALVNFSAGTKRVFCSAPTKVLLPDETGNSGKVLTTNGTDPAWTTTLNGMTIGNITPGTGAFTTLSASSTVSGTGFSTYLASPPAIGGTTPAAGNFTTLGATGNVTLGDASADTLTINGTAVSIPNNLNFDSNTLFIDAANNLVGIGTSSPSVKLDISNPTAGAPTVLGLSGGNAGAVSGEGATLSFKYNGPAGQGLGAISGQFDSTGTAANGRLVFSTRTAESVTEKMRIDSSGNLGLGVTPGAIGGGHAAFSILAQGNGLLGAASSIHLIENCYWNGSAWVRVDTTAPGYIQLVDGNFKFFNGVGGTAGGAFSPTQAMTLDASGNLLVGDTSPNGKVYAKQGADAPIGNFYMAKNNGGSSAAFKIIDDRGFSGVNSGQVLYLYAWDTGDDTFDYIRLDSYNGTLVTKFRVLNNGSIFSAPLTGGATTLSVDASGFIIRTPSDRNLKINDGLIPYGLAEVNRLRPVIHEWTEAANMGDGKSIGFIAQEIEDIIPEVISGNESKSLDYGKLTAVLTKAIQELHAEIELLKAKVN